MLVVMRALASSATTLAVASTHVDDVKIINFYMITGIISLDAHFGTFGSEILGNIISLRT